MLSRVCKRATKRVGSFNLFLWSSCNTKRCDDGRASFCTVEFKICGQRWGFCNGKVDIEPLAIKPVGCCHYVLCVAQSELIKLIPYHGHGKPSSIYFKVCTMKLMKGLMLLIEYLKQKNHLHLHLSLSQLDKQEQLHNLTIKLSVQVHNISDVIWARLEALLK
jgi:hypothetical protein